MMAAPGSEHRADGPPGGDEGLQPEFPDEAGVDVPRVPIEKVETERLVENEVRARLEADGFTDEQILRWVEGYFAEHGEGEPDDVVAWIRGQESSRRDAPRRDP
jgi:hypothetical protein